MARKLVPAIVLALSLLAAGLAGPAATGAAPRAPGAARSRAVDSIGLAAGPNLTIDGSQRFQRIDGWGVNANPKNWSVYPTLGPALDLLVSDLGATLWRVDVFGNSDWEATNDNGDPFTPDWTYFNNLYGTNTYFQDLWATLARLNADGVQPILSASGLVPAWMGGTTINSDDEFVESFATLLYYARNTAHIQFTWADPLNETNQGPPEGPSVDPGHFDTILQKLHARLVSMGMPDVRLIAPETTRPDQSYDGAILGDPSVAPYVAAYAGHAYSVGDFSSVIDQIKTSSYPQPNLWVTEYSSTMFGNLDGGQQVPDEWAFTKDMMNNLFSFLSTGTSAALVWDAYDNYHDHAQSYTRWGLLDTTNGYAPKKRYYGTKQLFKFVPAGSVRIQANASLNGVSTLAFVNDATGTLTIVGMNTNSSAQTLTGSLVNVTTPASLALYQTTSTQNTAAAGSVPVSGGSFSVTVPADSIFTLTGAACSPCPTATPTPTPRLAATATTSASPTASRSVGGIAEIPTTNNTGGGSGSGWWPYAATAVVVVLAVAALGAGWRTRLRRR